MDKFSERSEKEGNGMKYCDPAFLGFLLSCILRNPESESRSRQLEAFNKMLEETFSERSEK